MSYDIPFYDTVDMKKAAHNDHGEHASAGEDVFTLLGDWQEDTLDIQAFLQSRNVDTSSAGRLPTPVIVRPSNLDLTPTSNYDMPRSQVSPHRVHQVPDVPQVSPQNSPYGHGATMFDYGSISKQQQQPQQQQQSQQQQQLPQNQQLPQHQSKARCLAQPAASPCTPVFGNYAAPGSMMAAIKEDDTSSLDSYQAHCRKRSATSVSSDRDPDAYRAKRERNNVAVRKSREKKKMREQETEKRVKELSDENAGLQSKVELLSKQLTTIKSLFSVLSKSLPLEQRRRAEQELDSLGVGRLYEPGVSQRN